MTIRYGAQNLVFGQASVIGVALVLGVVFAALLLLTPIIWAQEISQGVGTAAQDSCAQAVDTTVSNGLLQSSHLL
jgi:hypothetical protein